MTLDDILTVVRTQVERKTVEPWLRKRQFLRFRHLSATGEPLGDGSASVTALAAWATDGVWRPAGSAPDWREARKLCGMDYGVRWDVQTAGEGRWGEFLPLGEQARLNRIRSRLLSAAGIDRAESGRVPPMTLDDVLAIVREQVERKTVEAYLKEGEYLRFRRLSATGQPIGGSRASVFTLAAWVTDGIWRNVVTNRDDDEARAVCNMDRSTGDLDTAAEGYWYDPVPEAREKRVNEIRSRLLAAAGIEGGPARQVPCEICLGTKPWRYVMSDESEPLWELAYEYVGPEKHRTHYPDFFRDRDAVDDPAIWRIHRELTVRGNVIRRELVQGDEDGDAC